MNEYFIQQEVSLKKYNTMRLEATAALLAHVYSINGLIRLITDNAQKKLVLLGNGSNTIFSQDYYDESYLFIVLGNLDQIEYDGQTIKVQCGVSNHQLAWFAQSISSTNYSFLEDIPGSIGGSLIMNAGAYGFSIGDHVIEVTYYDYQTESIITRQTQPDDFNYRSSWFATHPCVVLSATFRTYPDDYATILQYTLELKKKRYLNQPREYPNAGSVFKRPQLNGQEHYIYQLFDGCGLRGYQIGGARISDKHPGFFINTGNATGKDLVELINYAQQSVLLKYSIMIELEWKII
jgi:UDP-N-acetylmuramate dehydrogenase